MFQHVDRDVNNSKSMFKNILNLLLYLRLQYICTLMENHSDFLPFEEDNENQLIQKYLEMRSNGAQFYYDVEEFEELIDYFLFDSNQDIVQDLIVTAKGQHPDSSTISLKEAETLVYADHTKRAIEIIENVKLYEDSNPEHYFSKASIYSMANQKDKAIEILNRLIAISENEDLVEAKMALAKEYQELGDYHRCINQYQEILKEVSNHEDALMELSLSCELSGKNTLGIKIINEFIDENPYSHFAWFSLGNSYLNIENYEEAINAYEYATAINEEFSEAFFNLGNTLMKVERYADAIEAYKSSISDYYADPVTYNFIGHCYMVLEKNEKAIEYFQLSVNENPEYADGWMGFAVAYANMDNSQEGLLYIEKAIKLNPNNMYYQYFHADLKHNIGLFEEAEKIYQKVFESELESTGIYLDYTESLVTNQKSEVALQVLVEGISKFPEESLLYYRYAALMLQLGHELDAESILQLALEIDPDQSSQLFSFYPEAEKYDGIMDLIENYK